MKVDIAINGDSVDALSFVCHRDASQRKGRDVARRLKEVVATYVSFRLYFVLGDLANGLVGS